MTWWVSALLAKQSFVYASLLPSAEGRAACCIAAVREQVLRLCRFAFGGSGVIFGGKDVFVSEVTGGFSCIADGHGTGKQGVPTARLIVKVGNTDVTDPQR